MDYDIIKSRLVRLKGYFWWQSKLVNKLFIWSLIFGVFITVYRLSMVLNLTQQGLKKSQKSLEFHDPEPVKTLIIVLSNLLLLCKLFPLILAFLSRKSLRLLAVHKDFAWQHCFSLWLFNVSKVQAIINPINEKTIQKLLTYDVNLGCLLNFSCHAII